jgi:hypothetical protein
VQPLSKASVVGRRRALGVAGAAALLLSLSGCASTWDDITSRDFQVGHLFSKPDPLVVLRDSSDGNERHKALAALREPLAEGGTQHDQDIVLEILRKSAVGDDHPLCRMAAIRALGRFKDPRAAEIIENAYLQKPAFGDEMACLIRQQCLKSLTETGGPVAERCLILVAKEPPASGSNPDKQETLDRRLLAVRGLSKFKDPVAAETLLQVLRTDKDIALRDRAYESLVACTGKDLPADSPQWDVAVRQPAAAPADIQPTGGVDNRQPAPTPAPVQPVPAPAPLQPAPAPAPVQPVTNPAPRPTTTGIGTGTSSRWVQPGGH